MTDYYSHIQPCVDRDRTTEMDTTAIDDSTPWAKSRTRFFHTDASHGVLRSSGSRVSWKELEKYHEGMYESDYRQRLADADKERDIETLFTQTEITAHEQQQCRDIIRSIETPNAVGVSEWRVVILATIILVVNTYGRHIQREEIYDTLVEALDVSRSTLYSARDNIRSHLSSNTQLHL